MIVNIIKTDGEKVYFVNKNTGTKVKKYTQNNDIQMVVTLEDDSILQVDSNQIYTQFGGQLLFEYNGDKYIIDDGYRDILIRCGYLVMDNYDKINQFNKETGKVIRAQYLSQVNNAISYLNETKYGGTNYIEKNSIKNTFQKYGYTITVYIDSVNNLVTKNQQRKANMLAYYPFDKNMDKYGTLYVSIFAKKELEVKDKEKYKAADGFIEDIVEQLYKTQSDHNYKFVGEQIKKRLNNWPGL